MKTEENLSPPSAEEMRELIASLSPAERASLNDSDFITEDEADLIMADREMKEPGEWITAEELFRQEGYTPRRLRK